MDDALFGAWRQAVDPGDTVVILGDIAIGGLSGRRLKRLRAAPGRKVLVVGNHEFDGTLGGHLDGFDEVFSTAPPPKRRAGPPAPEPRLPRRGRTRPLGRNRRRQERGRAGGRDPGGSSARTGSTAHSRGRTSDTTTISAPPAAGSTGVASDPPSSSTAPTRSAAPAVRSTAKGRAVSAAPAAGQASDQGSSATATVRSAAPAERTAAVLGTAPAYC